MSFEMTALGLAWIAIVIMALVISGLVRQVHLLTSGHQVRKLQLGPAPGSQAPDLVQHRLPPDRPAVIFFAERGCSSCESLLPSFSQLARQHARAVAFVVAVAEHDGFPTRPSDAVTQVTGQAEAFERFNVSVTPFGVAVSGDGRVVAAGPIASPEEFERLLADITDDLQVA